MKRKCSYRILFIPKSGPAIRITQDIRRHRNRVTGIMEIVKIGEYPFNVWNAKSMDCSLVVREK